MALVVFGALIVLFIFISAFSFTGHNRPDPSSIRPLGIDAVEGKRIFQAYNCMDCHTVVGNGAYFAPDLTSVYADDGPAWLMAFFSQLTIWPTKSMVDSQIPRLSSQGFVISKAAYYRRFQAAAGDAADRGGWTMLMPRLRLKPHEMRALVAWMAYVSQLNTEGWPPATSPDPTVLSQTQNRLHQVFGGPAVPIVPPTPKNQ